MCRKGLLLCCIALLFSLASLPLSAQGLPAAGQCGNAVKTLAESAAPAPDPGLFAPKAENRSCYPQCVMEWNATMCVGYEGAMLQQCQADGAEGCRCYCYGCN